MHQLTERNRPPGFRPVWARLALLLLCVLAGQAQADGTWDDCVRATGNNPLYYHWYPATTITFGNDAAIGDVIGPWITTSQVAWKCTRRNIHAGKTVQVSTQAHAPYEHWNRFITHEGDTYGWYRFGDDNWALGYITRWRAIVDGVATAWTPMTVYAVPDYQDAASMVSVTKNAGDVYYINVETQLRFVKQNQPNFARNVLHSGYEQRIADPIYVRHHQKIGNTESLGGGTYLIGQMLLGTVTFVGGGTCTTPDVPVTLPTVVADEFNQNPIRGTTPFTLKFENCPAGLYSIGYYFTPATTILDATNGVIDLDNSSSATGVGLQLTEDNGTALKFGLTNTYQLAYDSSTGGSYSVDLKAAYYKTSSAPVGSGNVSSSMTVTLKYQ